MTPRHSARWVPIGVWLAGLALCGAWIAWHVEVQQNLATFMPQGTTPEERLLVEGLAEGPGSRILLLAIGGADPARLAAASRQLVERMRATGRFARVENGAGGLDAPGQARLFGWRYLLSPTVTAERFTAAGLRAALQARLEELASPAAPLVKELLAADPTAEIRSLLLALRPEHAPPSRLGVWFNPDEREALLLAETRAAGLDLDAQEQTLAAVRNAFAALPDGGGLHLTLSGPAAMAVAARAAIRAESTALGIAASVLVVAILLLAYRSWHRVALGWIPLATGALAAIAVTDALLGRIHGITLAFGITIMGVVEDYMMLLFSHLNADEPGDRTVLRVWPSIRLCALTAALGFGAMLFTQFPGMAQIGLFSVTGIAVAALTLRWVLPALLPGQWRARIVPEHQRWLRPLLRPPRGARYAAGAAAVAALIYLAWLARSPWENDLTALSPVPRAEVQEFNRLREALGASEPGEFIAVTAPDAESVLRKIEGLTDLMAQLRGQGAFAQYDSPARYLPSAETQRRRQRDLPAPSELERRMAAAVGGLPFRPGIFAPFLHDVAAARVQPPLGPDDLRDTALGLRVGSLLFPLGGRWIGLMPLGGVRDPERVAAAFGRLGDPEVRYVQTRPLVEVIMARFRDRAFGQMAWVAAALAGVLWTGLRSWRRVLRVFVPVAGALAITLALLLAAGVKLSLFHLMGLLLVLGVGADYGLFLTQAGDTPVLRLRALHAAVLGCLCTAVLFGLLAFSSIPVLRAIGMTVGIGVCTSLVMAVLLAQGQPPPDGPTPASTQRPA